MGDSPRSGLDSAITQPLQGDFMKKITDTQGEFLRGFDLLVSNPPYIPTKEEVENGVVETIGSPNFFSGISLPHYLMTQGLDQLPKGGNLVLLLTSCSLKSRYESYDGLAGQVEEVVVSCPVSQRRCLTHKVVQVEELVSCQSRRKVLSCPITITIYSCAC